MLHMTIKIEQQLKTRESTQSNCYPEHPSWRKSFIREEKNGVKPKIDAKTTPSTSTALGKPESALTRNWDIKCYKYQGLGHMAKQCLNKRSMVLRESGEIVTNDEGDDNTMPLLEDVSDDEWQMWSLH